MPAPHPEISKIPPSQCQILENLHPLHKVNEWTIWPPSWAKHFTPSPEICCLKGVKHITQTSLIHTDIWIGPRLQTRRNQFKPYPSVCHRLFWESFEQIFWNLALHFLVNTNSPPNLNFKLSLFLFNNEESCKNPNCSMEF